MGIVSIRKTSSGIKEALILGMADIGGMKSVFEAGDRVLIKPNLNDDICYTNKDLVSSLIGMLRDFGVADISSVSLRAKR